MYGTPGMNCYLILRNGLTAKLLSGQIVQQQTVTKQIGDLNIIEIAFRGILSKLPLKNFIRK